MSLDRRTFLQGLSVGALGALAGCNTPTATASAAARSIPALPAYGSVPDEAFWRTVRAQYPLLDDPVYLNTGGLGPAAPAVLLVPAGWLLVGLLVPLILIDLDHLWLPEPLCRWGVGLGLLVTAIAGGLQGEAVARPLLLWHLLAASAGLLGFEAVSAGAGRLLGKPALGLGDAKLAALLGAWLGLTGLGLMVVLAVFSGAAFGVIGLLSGRLQRGQPFPFGPFLAGAGLAVWIGGNGFWLQLLAPLLAPGAAA